MAMADNSKKTQVTELQKMLRAVSYSRVDIPKVNPDGVFGKETTEALRIFQRQIGLAPTGEADFTTWNALRSEAELSRDGASGGKMLDAFPGADYIHIQVSESGRRKFTQSKRTFEDKVDDILAGYYRGEQSASERMREVYRSIVLSENTAVCIRGIIRAVNAERGAVLFHCATGKDRTGIVAALLLRLLGADDAAIYADYMRTNETLEHELAQAYSLAMAKSRNDKAAVGYVLGFFAACPCWLTAALDTLDSNFGSAAEYAANIVGVSEGEVANFIRTCVEHF